MVEGASQEVFFWQTNSWVMSKKSSCESNDQNGSRSLCDKQSHEMKQDMMKDPNDSSSGDQEAVIAKNVADENDGDAIKMENEDNMKVMSRDENDKGKGTKVEVSEHNLHTWTERERRKKMKGMFQELHSLVPSLSHKADKATIVDEAITFIKTLEQKVQQLENKKLERLYGVSSNTPLASPNQPQTSAFSTSRESFLADQGSSTSHYGPISPSDSTSFPFPMCSSPTNFQTWASSNVTLNTFGPHAHFSICAYSKPGLKTGICVLLEKYNIEVVSVQICSDQSKCLLMIHAYAKAGDHFVEAYPYEDVYKQAATEIMQWVGSKSS
ncbi:transcription factor bHLH95-like [Rutidosis leptorrhynchoides]|uniref:transcription factor bHLH95-like n=1 Tax=Rutidosis leptorrhynchoides TaxID=125765 RepID=UPI003A9A1B56